jgi:hypothetical protein
MTMFGSMTPDMMQMMMQQMNSMQNGQWPNMMGKIQQFKTTKSAAYIITGMGMGMGMNPMDMFTAFGMQGMGGMNPNMMSMNGMNGMMGGMDFNGNNFGGGGGGGWNGQQMNSGGDYGASSGYYPDGGYNQSSHQGNYPPHMQSHQHNKFSMKNSSYNQQQGSFRGSTRGYGRGYHNNQGFHGRSYSQNNTGVSEGPPLNAPAGPKAMRENTDAYSARNRASSKTGSDQQQASSTDDGVHKDTTSNDDKQQVSDVRSQAAEQTRAQQANEDQQPGTEDMTGTPGDTSYDKGKDYFNQTNGTPTEGQYDQRSYRGGYRGRGEYEARGGWRGRGGFHSVRTPDVQPTTPVEPAGVGVAGAPSGPKAMREGNVYGGRVRGGLHPGGRGHSQSISSAKPEEYA